MKSGPTLAEATRRPRLAKAAINPVATVVFPTPEWVPEMTMRGPSVGTPHPATGRAPARGCGPSRSFSLAAHAGLPIRHYGVMRIVSLLPSATEILYALNLG